MADFPAPIVFERVIDVSVDDAFALFTEPERLRRWQAVSASVNVTVGGEYRLTVVPGNIIAGTFSEVDPGKRLVYSWQWQGDNVTFPNESTIAVDFEALGDKTRVTLTHSGLPDDTAVEQHSMGWQHFCDRLVDAAAGSATMNPWGMEDAADEYDLLTAAEASWAVCSHIMAQLGPEDAGRETPCEGLSVDDLVDHLMESLRDIGGLAGADLPEEAALQVEMRASSAGHPENYIANVVEPVLAAWRARGTEGEMPMGDGTAPAEMMAGILSLEFMLHAWDFAQAADIDIDVPPGLIGAVQLLADQIILDEYRGALSDGKGFAAQTVPSTQDPLTVLAAFTGRAT